jgi:hypothetical protein
VSLIELRRGDISTSTAEAVVTSASPTPASRGAMIDQVQVCVDDVRDSANEAEAREQLSDLISWLAAGSAHG